MQIGRLKFWNDAKGYGFFAPDDGSNDVFVHISAFDRAGISEFKEGNRFSFEVEANKRTGKPGAANLRVIE